jgi:PAS domain S-box-containing protein
MTAHALLIDDDEGLLRLASRALLRSGYRVSIAASTAEARSAMAMQMPEVLVVDYALAGAETGLDFLRALRAAGLALPAILCTGFADEARAIEALRSGVADIVPKSDGYLDYLPEAIERVLRETRIQRELAEAQRVREREAYYRTLAEAIPQLVWSADRDGHCDFASNQLLEYIGATFDELAGDPWVERVIHPDDRARTRRAFAGARRHGAKVDVEHRLRAADGRYRWFNSRAAPLFASNRTITRWFGASADIDQQKRAGEERETLLASERAARAEAERASRVKDEFVATLSHELRTPLNAIVGWTQFLLRDASDPERVKRGLEVIDRNARAQTQMVDDLLDLSRVMEGKLRLDVERVDLADVVNSVIGSVQPAADAKEIRITPIFGSASPIQGDPSRLQQVVWNLLANAIKFTPRRGKVRVTLRRVDSEVELAVSDTGQGIKPEFIQHVFERFRQEDAGTTRRYGGLGLGLSIAKQLVEMHGGRIEAASGGEGHGATFVVRFPVASVDFAPERAPQPTSSDAPLALAGLHVLVVEDEPDARELVQRVLHEHGARTTAVGNARDALSAFEAAPPDVIVSDIGMPGEDGYELIRKLRALEEPLGRVTPAAALTAFARSEDRRRALLAGFQTHLAKPVDPLELLVVIASLAGRTKALGD